jgi:anti-sigma-K factor RskA
VEGLSDLKHECITKDGQERAALYALGALSQFEARAFDSHLREGCPSCDHELSQFNEVVGVLGTAVEPIAPPPYLRDLLALRIQREAPETPSREGSVSRFPVQRLAEPASVKKTSSGTSHWIPWAVAALFLLGFAFSFIAWRTEHTNLQVAIEQKEQSAAAAQIENAELKQQLTATSSELVEINSVLSQPAWQIIPLKGQEPAPASSATIYWDTQGNRWVVSADLPPAPAGKVYQLWFVTPQAKISAGLIRPDRNGHGFSILKYPPDIGPVAAAAITLEPDGGSEQPTMPIYAVGTT